MRRYRPVFCRYGIGGSDSQYARAYPLCEKEAERGFFAPHAAMTSAAHAVRKPCAALALVRDKKISAVANWDVEGLADVQNPRGRRP